MQESIYAYAPVYVPVDFFTVVKQGIHGQLWGLSQMVSLFFYTSAWQGIFIALADTFSFY